MTLSTVRCQNFWNLSNTKLNNKAEYKKPKKHPAIEPSVVTVKDQKGPGSGTVICPITKPNEITDTVDNFGVHLGSKAAWMQTTTINTHKTMNSVRGSKTNGDRSANAVLAMMVTKKNQNSFLIFSRSTV